MSDDLWNKMIYYRYIVKCLNVYCRYLLIRSTF